MTRKNDLEPKITKTAQKVKKSTVNSTTKELIKTYKNTANLIKNQLQNEDGMTFSEGDLELLKKKINKELKNASKEIKNIIKASIITMIDKTIANNLKYYKEIDKKYGSNLEKHYENKYKDIKNEVIKSVIGGELYKDKNTLSDRIWKDLQSSNKSINAIINTGLKNKDHPIDIAKRLEKYVNPLAQKDFNWSIVYPGSKNKIEYNSLRLARTSINHAHHQTVIGMAKRNPLVDKVEWMSAHTDGRTCELCASRDGNIYPLDKVPTDHPNGMCDILEVMPADEMMESYMDAFMESDFDDFDEFIMDFKR